MTIDPTIWTNTIAKTKTINEDSEINSNKWLESVPKKNNDNLFKKYSLVSILFIFGLIAVSFIKNETRYLEKEITELQKSIYEHRFNLHQATLDHEVIASPENISLLANDYLETDFIYYKRDQIRNLNNSEKNLVQTKTKKIKEKKSFSDKSKVQIINKINKKKEDLAKLKKIYSEPKVLSQELKIKLSKKIKLTQKELTYLYNEPEIVIKSERAQRWAAFQIVKIFLGIPIVPGK
jgi:hypothetical protein